MSHAKRFLWSQQLRVTSADKQSLADIFSYYFHQKYRRVSRNMNSTGQLEFWIHCYIARLF